MSNANRKQRLDEWVVIRGLAENLSHARALILAGEIRVNGQTKTKAGETFAPNSEMALAHPGPHFVSRGGMKLAGALDALKIAVKDAVCLDVGSSTGGFTDCLLQRGAKSVFAIDVGKGQLDPRIRNDSRVTAKESFHANRLTPVTFPSLVDLATIDVSFISLKTIIPFVIPCLTLKGILLALIKPQFEAPKDLVGTGGIVREEATRNKINSAISDFVAAKMAPVLIELIPSPLKGAKGNIETFLCAKKTSR